MPKKPKKPKKPNDASQESTLGPLAKALGDVDGDKSAEDEPKEPGNGGDSEPAPEGQGEKSEGPSEGETPQEGEPGLGLPEFSAHEEAGPHEARDHGGRFIQRLIGREIEVRRPGKRAAKETTRRNDARILEVIARHHRASVCAVERGDDEIGFVFHPPE